MKAKYILDQIEQELALIVAKESAICSEKTAEIIQLIKDCIIQGMFEDNTSVRSTALQHAYKLLQGTDGLPISINQEQYVSITKIYNIQKRPFYRIPASFLATDRIFGSSLVSNIASVEAFIKNQKRIRLLIDDGPNFGNQAANVNLIYRLREIGFNGTIELIYPATEKYKLAQLYDIAIDEISGLHSILNIKFIELNHYLTLLKKGKIKTITLGMTAAVDANQPSHMCTCPTIPPAELTKNNFANFLKVKVFVSLSPYHHKERAETLIYIQDIPTPVKQHNSKDKALIVPANNFIQAKEYLQNTVKGQALITLRPALATFFNLIQAQSINFVPAYGNPLKKSALNLLNLIFGAQYAQQHNQDLQKPIVISILYPFNHQQINELLNKLNDVNSNQHTKSYQPILNQRLHELSTIHNIQFLDCLERDTVEQLKKLAPKQIVVLFTGSLPKIVFDGLFTYTGNNKLLAVTAGANSHTSLLQTGKPHIHYADTVLWDHDLDLAPADLKKRLEHINYIACVNSQDEWRGLEAAQLVGEFIIEAHTPNSPLNQYFQKLKAYILEPANDRIMLALYTAMKISKLSTEENKLALAAHHYMFYIGSDGEAFPPDKIKPELTSITNTCEVNLLNGYLSADTNEEICLISKFSSPLEGTTALEQAQTSSASRSNISWHLPSYWLTMVKNNLNCARHYWGGSSLSSLALESNTETGLKLHHYPYGVKNEVELPFQESIYLASTFLNSTKPQHISAEQPAPMSASGNLDGTIMLGAVLARNFYTLFKSKDKANRQKDAPLSLNGPKSTL